MRIVSLIKKWLIAAASEHAELPNKTFKCDLQAFNLSSWQFYFFKSTFKQTYQPPCAQHKRPTSTGCYLTWQNTDCRNTALDLSNLLRSPYIRVLSSKHSWSTTKKRQKRQMWHPQNASFVQQPAPKPKRHFIHRHMRKKHTSFYTSEAKIRDVLAQYDAKCVFLRAVPGLSTTPAPCGDFGSVVWILTVI